MAWDYVAQSGPTTVTTNNITLVEPTGAQEGDLLVACIAFRQAASGSAFTLPSGWNLVATQQRTDNTSTTTTSSIASGLMAYIVRGASAPSYAFTRSAGANVAIGQVMCYRGNHATPYDTGSANTLASNSATVTTGTITTAEDGELLVAMAAGADNVTWSAFDAATDPTTASGATDTSTEPTAGTWIERADSGTNSGADTSLAVADAIRATAGSTGTVQVTASASSRHVMIVGAFKLAADTTDDLTATGVSSGTPSVAAPALGQVHALAATGVAAAAPSVGAPAITSGGGGIAFVQGVKQIANSAASVVLTLNGVAAGNTLVVGCSLFEDGGGANGLPNAVSDSQGNTWAAAVTGNRDLGGGPFAGVAIYVATGVAAGDTTVTITGNSGSYFTAGLAEFSGVDVDPVDVTATTNNRNTTPASGTTASTSQASALALACMVSIGEASDQTNIGIDLPSGYTNISIEQDSWNDVAHSFDYRVLDATGAQSASWGTISYTQAWVGGIVVLKATGSGHALTATSVSSGTPSVGSPAITQAHVLAATAAAAGAPTVGAPSIAEANALATTGAATAAPSVGSPALTQAHALAATGVSAEAPSVGAPAITQAHVVAATGAATGVPSVGAPILAQIHALAAAGIATGAPSVGAPVLAEPDGTDDLSADSIAAAAPSVGSPAILQVHALGAASIAAGGPSVGAPALSQLHALLPIGVVAGVPQIEAPALGQVHALGAAGSAAGVPGVGAPSLTSGETFIDLIAIGITAGQPIVGVPWLNFVPAPGRVVAEAARARVVSATSVRTAETAAGDGRSVAVTGARTVAVPASSRTAS